MIAIQEMPTANCSFPISGRIFWTNIVHSVKSLIEERKMSSIEVRERERGRESAKNCDTSPKKENRYSIVRKKRSKRIKEIEKPANLAGFMAESMGLEPTGLLHLTRFPGELLSHSVNPPNFYWYLSQGTSII